MGFCTCCVERRAENRVIMTCCFSHTGAWVRQRITSLGVVEERSPPPPLPFLTRAFSGLGCSSPQLLHMAPGDIMLQSGQMSPIRIVSDRDNTAYDCHLTMNPLLLWHAWCYLAVAGCLQQLALIARTGAAMAPAGSWPSESTKYAEKCASFCEQMSLISMESRWIFVLWYNHKCTFLPDVFSLLEDNFRDYSHSKSL